MSSLRDSGGYISSDDPKKYKKYRRYDRGNTLGLMFSQLFGVMANRKWKDKSLLYQVYKDVRQTDLSHDNKLTSDIVLIMSYGWAIVPRYIVWLLRLLKIVHSRPLVRILKDGIEIREGDIPQPSHFGTLLPKKEDWANLDDIVLRATRYRLQAWVDMEIAKTYPEMKCLLEPLSEEPSEAPSEIQSSKP